MPNLLKTIILTAVLGFAPMSAFAEGSGNGGGNTNVDTNVGVDVDNTAVAGAMSQNNIAIVGVPSVSTSGDCAAGASFGNTAFAFGLSGIPQFCKNLMMGQLAAQERENIPASWYNVAMKRALDIKDAPAVKAGKATSASAPVLKNYVGKWPNLSASEKSQVLKCAAKWNGKFTQACVN